MPDQTTPPPWYQPALLEVGYGAVSVEFIVHLDGPTGTAYTGLSIYDTATREPIAIQAPAHRADVWTLPAIAEWMGETLHEIRGHLAPFG